MKYIGRRRPKTMKSLLSRKLPCSRRNIYVGDKFLTPVTDTDFRRFLVTDETDLRKYRSGIFECNLFALNLVVNAKNWFLKEYGINAAVGMLWTKKTSYRESHAFNFYVTPIDFYVRYIEPQTDKRVILSYYGRPKFVFI